MICHCNSLEQGGSEEARSQLGDYQGGGAVVLDVPTTGCKVFFVIISVYIIVSAFIISIANVSIDIIFISDANVTSNTRRAIYTMPPSRKPSQLHTKCCHSGFKPNKKNQLTALDIHFSRLETTEIHL